MAGVDYVTPGDFGTSDWANSVARRANVGWLWYRTLNRSLGHALWTQLNSTDNTEWIYSDGVFLTQGGVPSATDTDATQILTDGVYEVGCLVVYQSSYTGSAVVRCTVNGAEATAARVSVGNTITSITPASELITRLELSAGDLVAFEVYPVRSSGTSSVVATEYRIWGNLIRES